MNNGIESEFLYFNSQFPTDEQRRAEAKLDPAVQEVLARTYTVEDGSPAMIHEDLLELEEIIIVYGLAPEVAFELAVEFWNKEGYANG